jgi:hypothetical protein
MSEHEVPMNCLNISSNLFAASSLSQRCEHGVRPAALGLLPPRWGAGGLSTANVRGTRHLPPSLHITANVLLDPLGGQSSVLRLMSSLSESVRATLRLTAGRSVCLGAHDQMFVNCLTVTVLSYSGALSDERAGVKSLLQHDEQNG